MFEADPSPLEIEVLVLPGTTLMLFASLIEPLRAANRVVGRGIYSWHISSADGGEVPTASGVPVPVAGAFTPGGQRPLFVTCSYGVHQQVTGPLRHAIRQAARTRPVLGGVEAGCWMLAHAGVLDGYRATTHWEDLTAFAARFPEIDVIEAPLVRDRARVTTAGGIPTMDLMLDLIAHRQGPARAHDVARLLNYLPATARGAGRVADAKVARAVDLMERNLDEPVEIRDIARQTGLSARHLQARFMATLGTGPRAHYMGLRLHEARRLLRETDLAVLEVAAATGFASPSAFTRAYARHHGETPSATRTSDCLARLDAPCRARQRGVRMAVPSGPNGLAGVTPRAGSEVDHDAARPWVGASTAPSRRAGQREVGAAIR